MGLKHAKVKRTVIKEERIFMNVGEEQISETMPGCRSHSYEDLLITF
jgi:hypothetical protein